MEIFYAAATFFLFFHRRLKIPDKHHYFVFAAIYTFESKVQVTINRWPRMVLHPILACAFCCLLNHYDLVWWSFMIIWIPIIVNFATYSIKVNESTLTQLFDRHQLSKPQRENLLFSDRFKRMTSEQYSIVNHDVHDDDVVKINAFAGTGKQYLTNGWYSNWFSLAMRIHVLCILISPLKGKLRRWLPTQKYDRSRDSSTWLTTNLFKRMPRLGIFFSFRDWTFH